MNRSVPAHAQEAAPAVETHRAEVPVARRGLSSGGVFAAVIALLLVGYIALWAASAIQLQRGVRDWVAARQAEGYRIAHGPLAIGGFPRLARVTLSAPVIAAPDGRALGWSWAGEQAVIEANPLRPETVTVRLAGEEAVSINVDGKLRTYRGVGTLTLQVDAGRLPAATSLVVHDLFMAAEEPGDAIEIERLSASGRSADRPSSTGAGYAIRIEADGIRLPRQLDLPLGESIAHLAIDAVLDKRLGTRSDLPGALAAWRDGGGAVELNKVRFRYGPLHLDGSGTASLDAALQPIGTFVARIQGFQEAVSALGAGGYIDEQTALRAKAALTILSRAGADGGPATLSVPLSLHDRRLSVGPLPLMLVPVIEWPRGPSPRSGGGAPLALTPSG
jgi:hypothetical protein